MKNIRKKTFADLERDLKSLKSARQRKSRGGGSKGEYIGNKIKPKNK